MTIPKGYARAQFDEQAKIDETKRFIAEYPAWLINQLFRALMDEWFAQNKSFPLLETQKSAAFKNSITPTPYWFVCRYDSGHMVIELCTRKRERLEDSEEFSLVRTADLKLSEVYDVAEAIDAIVELLCDRFPFFRKHLDNAYKRIPRT